jgi:hypothetical protein
MLAEDEWAFTLCENLLHFVQVFEQSCDVLFVGLLSCCEAGLIITIISINIRGNSAKGGSPYRHHC